MLTYLPLELNNEQCVVFFNHDVVRVYDTIPDIDVAVNYTDYYITDHYTFVSGSDLLDSPVQCVAHEEITTNVFYRYDISDIIVSFTCIFFVSIVLIYFALKCFFRGLFK